MSPVREWFSRGESPRHADPEITDLFDDLVTANQILFHQGVLDSFGHVSARHPKNSDRFFMSRAMAPGMVGVADILEFGRDGIPVEETKHSLYVERFIHSELYKARHDVNAIVHSHSPTVIPFSITQAELRPVFHRASFLSPSAPVFEIREVAGARNNMLVNDAKRGKALAETLGNKNVGADARPRKRGSGAAIAPRRIPRHRNGGQRQITTAGHADRRADQLSVGRGGRNARGRSRADQAGRCERGGSRLGGAQAPSPGTRLIYVPPCCRSWGNESSSDSEFDWRNLLPTTSRQ